MIPCAFSLPEPIAIPCASKSPGATANKPPSKTFSPTAFTKSRRKALKALRAIGQAHRTLQQQQGNRPQVGRQSLIPTIPQHPIRAFPLPLLLEEERVGVRRIFPSSK